jgi:type II secretory pathway pseudopilin PulG
VVSFPSPHTVLALGRKPHVPRRSRGFTYLLVLFLVALMGLGLTGVGNVWETMAKREKEEELLFVGDEFRRAIASFYSSTPAGQAARYPRSLDELVQDARFPAPVRHLRRIYRDPITGTTDWGLVRTADGGIVGIHSISMAAPRKTAGFRETDRDFTGKLHYSEWIFVPVGSLTATPPASVSPSASPSPSGAVQTP